MITSVVLNNKFAYLFFFISIIILYGNTIQYEHVLDDKIYLTNNKLVQSETNNIKDFFSTDLFAGYDQDLNITGNRYRPLTLLSFKLDRYVNSTVFSHTLNLCLYFLICCLLFYNLKYTLSFNRLVALIATILFLAHPVHVEVVANIKSRDELLSVLFSLYALILVHVYIVNNKKRYLFIAFWVMVLAFFSKESTVVYLLLIPLILYYKKVNYVLAINSYLPIFNAFLIYFSFRYFLVPFDFSESTNLLNNPFFSTSFNQYYSTVFVIFFKYLSKAVFPIILTHDYYPFVFEYYNFGLLTHLLLVIFCLFCLYVVCFNFKKRNWMVFGVLFFTISLMPYMNIFFNIGTFMAERFLFNASIGAVIFLAFVIYYVRFVNYYFGSVLLLFFVIFFSIKTKTRTYDWASELQLSSADIHKSINSAKCNVFHAGNLLKEYIQTQDSIYLIDSEFYLHRALDIYSEYNTAKLLMANFYMYKNDLDSAQLYLADCNSDACVNNLKILSNLMLKEKKFHSLESCYEVLINKTQEAYYIYRLALLRYRYLQKYNESLVSLKNLLKTDSLNQSILVDIGNIYFIQQDLDSAKFFYDKCLNINPKNELAAQNLSLLN